MANEAICEVNVSNQLLKYEIIKELGEGRCATVYLARRVVDQKEMALKNFQKIEDYCTQEWAIIKRLDLHQADVRGLLRYHEMIKMEDSHFLVMEFMTEGSIYAKGRLNFSWRDISAILADVCAGLAYLHDLHVCHADLKPENILLKREGDRWVAKIGDLGVSVVVGADPTALISLGRPIVTVTYRAPELGRVRTQSVSASELLAADIFALGLILVEIFSKKSLSKVFSVSWQGHLDAEYEMVLENLVSEGERAPIPSTFPAVFTKLARLCWHFDFRVRPSAGELAELFQRFFSAFQSAVPEETCRNCVLDKPPDKKQVFVRGHGGELPYLPDVSSLDSMLETESQDFGWFSRAQDLADFDIKAYPQVERFYSILREINKGKVEIALYMKGRSFSKEIMNDLCVPQIQALVSSGLFLLKMMISLYAGGRRGIILRDNIPARVALHVVEVLPADCHLYLHSGLALAPAIAAITAMPKGCRLYLDPRLEDATIRILVRSLGDSKGKLHLDRFNFTEADEIPDSIWDAFERVVREVIPPDRLYIEIAAPRAFPGDSGVSTSEQLPLGCDLAVPPDNPTVPLAVGTIGVDSELSVDNESTGAPTQVGPEVENARNSPGNPKNPYRFLPVRPAGAPTPAADPRTKPFDTLFPTPQPAKKSKCMIL